MAKDKRLYARFDIGFDEHDKIFPLSDQAFRALVEATLYARRQLTDGFLAERLAVKRWGQEVLEELSTNDPENPSLVRVEAGWMIHDFAEHQTTNADIEAKRAAGSAGGRAKARNTSSTSVAGATGAAKRNAGSTLAKTETETETVTSNEVTHRAREAFESVWDLWPKKTEKKKSQEQFVRVAKTIGVDIAAAHVRKFGDAYAATTETRYVPALCVWLRNERWTDDLPRSRQTLQPANRPSKAEEANDFVSRLERQDAASRSWEASGGHRELRQ